MSCNMKLFISKRGTRADTTQITFFGKKQFGFCLLFEYSCRRHGFSFFYRWRVGGMGETMTSKDKPMDWCLSKDCTRVQSNVRGKNMSGIVIGGKTTRSFFVLEVVKKKKLIFLFFFSLEISKRGQDNFWQCKFWSTHKYTQSIGFTDT